jgi:hypothetical protein
MLNRIASNRKADIRFHAFALCRLNSMVPHPLTKSKTDVLPYGSPKYRTITISLFPPPLQDEAPFFQIFLYRPDGKDLQGYLSSTFRKMWISWRKKKLKKGAVPVTI